MKKESSKLMSVRFGPSPTGGLHAGGVRTALYNYLLAKKHGGRFILRIEDTDQGRYVKGAEQYIVDSLRWLGIEFDESPEKGGDFGPYRQSERTEIYNEYVDILINNGFAYYAFDTPDELTKAKEENEYFMYNSTSRISMKNSLSMNKDEVAKLLKERTNWVVRIKYPDTPTKIEFTDEIRGDVSFMSSDLDDKVIWKKKDNLPTYHLANVIDDHLMKITHVIRGEEWVASTPLHVYLYDCFGWDRPSFSHLPLILGPNGKLSKRDGDKYGFPVFPMEWTNPITKEVASGYKEMGYFPDAVINILAFLGWNPGTEKEIYSLEELIHDFDISRVNKAGAKFNQEKAAWVNGQYIKKQSVNDLLKPFKDEANKRGITLSDETSLKIIEANKNKVNFVKEIFDVADYLFNKPTIFDKKCMKKWKSNSAQILIDLKNTLTIVNDWTENNIKDAFEKYVKTNDIKFGVIAPLLRLVLSGKNNGPSLFGIMELIGKNESLDRLINYNLPKKKIVDDKIVKPVVSKIDEFKEISDLILKTMKKLNNPQFLEKAPPSVVERETKKIVDLKQKLAKIV